MPEHREMVILEPFFILSRYCRMDWNTYMRFPCAFRKWLINRITKEMEEAQKEQNDIYNKIPNSNNNPQARTSLGKYRK